MIKEIFYFFRGHGCLAQGQNTCRKKERMNGGAKNGRKTRRKKILEEKNLEIKNKQKSNKEQEKQKKRN